MDAPLQRVEARRTAHARAYRVGRLRHRRGRHCRVEQPEDRGRHARPGVGRRRVARRAPPAVAGALLRLPHRRRLACARHPRRRLSGQPWYAALGPVLWSIHRPAPARSAIREDGAASLSVRADGPDRPAAHPISPWGSPPRRSRALCPAPGRRARGGDGQRAARHCARQCATSSRDDAHLAAGGGGRLVPLDPGGRRLRRHARPGRAVQGAAGGRGGGVGGLPRRRGLGGHVGRGAAGSCVCEVPVAVQAIHRTTVEGVARRK
mmetsp:Transcript_32909/g.106417  ORF Transcript_32909/g.106417 Transcript_32909/m.106417 type:complete len:264 (+) Transcript_32909:624-1415(+)